MVPGAGTDHHPHLPGAAHGRAVRAQEVPPAEPPQEGATRDLLDSPAVHQGRPGLISTSWEGQLCTLTWVGVRALPLWGQMGSQGKR